MILLNAAALGLLGLAVPLILLYLLKMKRHERTVSSTYLWQKVVNDIQANSPFQKLQKNLLLLLQLLILGLLAFAIARPTLATRKQEGRSFAVILDGSASMRAREADGRERFERARELALEIADNLGSGEKPGEMMLITAGRRTLVRKGFTSDRAALRRAIEELRPGDTRADAAEALALAVAALKDRHDPHIVFISDGAGTSLAGAETARNFRFLRVGEAAENLGITRLDVRAASPKALSELKAKGELAAGRYPYQIFAAVRNAGTKARKTIVTMHFDGQVVGAREVELPPGTETSIVFKEKFPPGLVEVRLEEEDALAADNVARAIVRPAEEIRVAVVGRKNPFLERVLRSMPYVDVAFPVDLSEGSWDLVICDRTVPAALPETNLLLIAPERDLEGYARAGTLRYPEILDWQKEHPLFRSADFHDVHISQAQAVKPETRGRVLAKGTGGAPLLLLTQEAGRSFRAILTFSLVDSDWPLRPSFPVFFANLLQYARDFNTLGNIPFYRTGTLVGLPPLGEADVSLPSGAKVRVPAGLFADTDEVGMYAAAWGSDRLMRFPVNLLDERETDIAPAREIVVGSETVAAQPKLTEINREIWTWIAGAILAVALLEWWMFHRKIGY